MDVFSTVVSAIDLAEKIWRTIDNFQKVPERLRCLQFDVKSLQETLEKLKETEFRGTNDDSLLQSEVQEIQNTLVNLQRIISQKRQKSGSSVLSRSLRTFRTQLKFDDLDELSAELQKRKASLSLMINMLVLSSIPKVDTRNLQAKTSKITDTQEKNRTTAVPVNHITRKEFLDTLDAPNYVEDDVRVKHATNGTATWIYEREEYKEWYHNPESRTLHLVGKMGSGKSVLTKGIIKTLKQMSSTREDQKCLVLYYYCTCVNRVDTASNILKGFIAQFALDRADVYDKALSGSELLQPQKSGGTVSWSFEALWLVFTRLVQLSGLSSLYCVVDALDECVDPNSLDELLSLLHQLARGKLIPQMSIKLFFSSREYAHIIHSLDYDADTIRLFVKPEVVVSDIRLAMQSHIASIKKRVKFQDDEVEVLQEAILKKADGMFLWVTMATRSIEENSYDATFETLEELIEDLPMGLKGLYENNWVKLVDSLPTAKVALANKILTWVLLAERPMSISELTMALAIEPGQKNIPTPKKLLRNLSGFILNYLAPFVEIITASDIPEGTELRNASSETLDELTTPPPPDTTHFVPKYKALDISKVRLVHQSVQEYLLEACNVRTGTSHTFEINLRKGHEYLARVCMTYLSGEELQLGWIDEENKNEWGSQITTDVTRDKVQERLNTHPFLAYAAKSWSFHVVKCQHLPLLEDYDENSKSHDVFQAVIDYLKNFRQGFACGAQARQLLMYWNSDIHFSPGPPVHTAAAKDLTIVLKRLLQEPGLDLDERDSEGFTALHYPTQAVESVDYPEDRLEVMQLLLKAGFSINAYSHNGRTPLHHAASFPIPSLVKILLDAGADPLIKDKEGFTALNNLTAVSSKEIVEALLDAGADVNSIGSNSMTPILHASEANSWDSIRILADRGGFISAQTEDGWACLHYVAQHGETELMKHLLKAGAKSNIRTTSGWTPLHSAARFDQLACYKAMIEHGVNSDFADSDGYSVFHEAAEFASLEFLKFLVESNLDVNVKTNKNLTPLHFAARRGCGSVVEFLLENKADPRARGSDGIMPLHTACIVASTEVSGLLLPFYGDIDCCRYKGNTALSLACQNSTSDPKFIEMLIARGANPNAAHEKGNYMTPLHCAASSGVTHAIDILLRNGAEIEKRSLMNLRPFTFATKDGNLEAAKLLLARGAKINAGSGGIGHDFTALEMAYFNGHVEIAKWLLDEGADPSAVAFTGVIKDAPTLPGHFEILKSILQKLGDLDAVDANNMFALQSAVFLDKLDLAKSLIDLGANRRKLTSQGDSLIHLASYNDNIEMLELLTNGWPTNEYSSLLNSRSFTPPQIAAINGRLQILQHFAKISPAETLRITKAQTLQYILRNSNAMAIFQVLSECGVLDLNLPTQYFKDTIIYAICFPVDTSSVDLEENLDKLISYGLDLNATNPPDLSILQRLALAGRPGVAKALIARGANLKQRDNSGRSTFDIIAATAARGRKTTPLILPPRSATLVSRRSPPYSTPSPPPATLDKTIDILDQSPTKSSGSLIPPQDTAYIAKSPYETAAMAFTENTDGTVLKDDNGGTILHVAASSGNVELVAAIIAKNPTMIEDENGWKPIMFAERSGFTDVVTLLSKLESTAVGAKSHTRSPSRWSSRLRGEGLVLDEDDSIVELPFTVNCYNGFQTNPEGYKISTVRKAFSVFSDAPIPYEVVDYYFEIEVIKDAGGVGALAVGFASLPQNFNFTMPGWPGPSDLVEPGEQYFSWGYHANFGFRTPGKAPAFSEPYAAPWTEGDVVGAGYSSKERTVYFVKNGRFQGIAFNDVKGVIYPMVGLAAGGTKIRGRFGVEPPKYR